MNGRYGIPWNYMQPDTFGEKFGGGRVPAGTRGYTWSNWEQWLAPDDGVEKEWTLEQTVGALAVGGAVFGVITLACYLSWKAQS